ncbi:MAG: isochorismatase family cysteine hydrolase [Candidatus Acidiferrum sp.]
MPEQLTLDPIHTAVLSMDNQAGIVAACVSDQDAMLTRSASVLERARNKGMCVIHVQVGFRPGLPEVGSRNPLFGALKASVQHRQLFEGPSGAIHPRLAPRGDDIVVTKHRVSAFKGTDLDMILRAKEIDTLVLFGIATSGVVLSTLLEASDADYRIVVIRDCCADMDAELHSNLIDKLFVRRATVLTASEFVAAVS